METTIDVAGRTVSRFIRGRSFSVRSRRFSCFSPDDWPEPGNADSPEHHGIENLWLDFRSRCWFNRTYANHGEWFNVACTSWCQHTLNFKLIMSVRAKPDIPSAANS